ncbi:hypothetical protein K504DRAFT_483954 [Pleomassaria siparia CBS 279.74]|uniref:Zn(2)-C6 fungal-type domain-containing protein n=1 Tax=Pleomassaria siparia CBS 279.74 TaxID=1314801 RepID=A0A6G1K1F6_9PLEO|nr:hypothetical protein K504DRAFT_483954 [Pleomassaria siparia CBS 279.74]
MSSSWNTFSIGTQEDVGSGPQVVGDEIPACASCRKRKLKCSREAPTCSHCLRLSIRCVYSPKQKPGLKTGALEALTRRVASLERILLDDEGSIRPQFEPGDEVDTCQQNGSIVSEDSDSPREAQIPPRSGESCSPHPLPVTDNGHEDNQETAVPISDNDHSTNTRKRKPDQPFLAESLLALDLVDISEQLPSQLLLEKLVDYFCVSFHHWIPYLHKQRLQTSVRKNSRDVGLDLVLHALVVATLRHMDRNDIFLDEDQVVKQTRISRYIVETFAMKMVSLESIQALIMIVFDYLNDGQTKKAWPLIGSLTRTVDYLQLTVEPSASLYGALMNPLKLIQPTDGWTELEERRRLFWVIFLLDRFCSVSTGWNTSLTSEDVHRRLPADGGYFTREEPVTTPYFGIWNKSSARIGKSLAHVPAQYNEDDPVIDQAPGSSPGSANGPIDSSKLGAFAYCIEATESLSQVTTFFLQQRINWQDKEHAVSWLTRFKELDLRLVHWKLFLPPRWKDSNISADTRIVDMDPNLTLAHLTHNTSMILLHHSIAYPAKGWKNYVALPKECSAQTCEHAAVETSNIVEKFLTHTRIPFVNVQFIFCTFVGAKALLFEHQATRKVIRPEFECLTRNLWEMSTKWAGASGMASTNGESDRSDSLKNQAAIYARHLEHLYELCQRDTRFRFDLYDHSCQKLDPEGTTTHQTATPQQHPGSELRERRKLSNKERYSSMSIPYSSIDPRIIPPSIAPNTPTLANIMSHPTARSPIEYRRPQESPQIVHTPTQSTFGIPPPYIGGPPTTSHFVHQSPQGYPPNENGVRGPLNQHTVQDQSLLSLSDTFMDSNFLGMDRVITFEDANFFLPGDALRW